MDFDWQGDSFLDDLQKDIGKNVEKAAIYLTKKVKQKLSKGRPGKRHEGKKGVYYTRTDPASAPGEAPKILTGQLRNSITWETDRPNLTATVGTNLEYGSFLETGTNKMEARPFLRTTLNEEAEKLNEIISGK